MSIIIGLDFGSHTASIALWYEEKNVIEVIADELGSRTIPTVVAYRNDEVIVGQAALSQQHKNSANTFADVRALILDESVTNVYVPVLEREVPVQEIVSHFFRNIHNQIKQQVGKPIRECVLSISSITLEESVRARLIECAQVGGIRIKAIVNDSAATLMAFGLDVVAPASAASAAGGSAAVSEAVAPFQRVLVVDIGWTAAVATVYGVSSGIFFTLGSRTVNQCSGSVLVKNMAEHCAKDFQRRAKVSCADSSKAMMRIRAQCEEAMKHLSTGQEATIDIDSLYEGIDYCSKITRARFEDLSSIPLVQLRVAITELLQSVSSGADQQQAAVEVDSVLLAGGLAAMPKLASVVKALFPSAVFPRARFEQSESVCIGAANQAKFLIETVSLLSLFIVFVCAVVIILFCFAF